MALFWMALFCIFITMSYVRAYPGTSMTVSYADRWKTFKLHINFSNKLFTTFHSCLCDYDRNQCCMDMKFSRATRRFERKRDYSDNYHHRYRDYDYYYHYYYYKATQATLCAQQKAYHDRQTYSRIYECTFNIASQPASIKCSRVLKIDVTQSNDERESFFLESKASYCSLPCVAVRWSRKWNWGSHTLDYVTSTANRFHKGSCMAGLPVTPTSAPPNPARKYSVPTTTTSISTTTKATSKKKKTKQKIQPTETETKPKAPETTTQKIKRLRKKDYSPSEDNTIFLAVVYTISGILIIIDIVLCVLIWRRRKQQQLQKQQSPRL